MLIDTMFLLENKCWATEEQAIEISRSSELNVTTNKNGKVKSEYNNYCTILEHDTYLSGTLRFNTLSGRPEISNVFWEVSKHEMRDYDFDQIRRIVSTVYGLEDKEKLRSAVNLVARLDSYHPVVEMLESLEWDGISRVENLFPRYLGAEKSEYTSCVTRLLFSGLIERALRPGCKYDLCIIIADTKQGTGKSSMCKMLALHDDFFSDSLRNLDDNKRAFEDIRGKWVIELSEMVATNRAKDVESIKSYLSRTADDYRQPYGMVPERYPRQCVFIGTTNKPKFLPRDKTGNRRFVPLLCDGDKSEMHPLEDAMATRDYIAQCYAEMMHYRKEQGPLSLVVPKEINDELTKMQEQGTPDDTRVGMIQEWLDNCQEDFVCTRMIWDEVFGGTYERAPRQYDLSDISEIMNLKIEGWEVYKGLNGNAKDPRKKFKKYGNQQAWVRSAGNKPRKRIEETPQPKDKIDELPFS